MWAGGVCVDKFPNSAVSLIKIGCFAVKQLVMKTFAVKRRVGFRFCYWCKLQKKKNDFQNESENTEQQNLQHST